MSAVESIFRLVLEATWRTACVIAVFVALRYLLRGRSSPRWLYWVWVAVAIRLLVPLTIPVTWSPFNLLRMAVHDWTTGIQSPDEESGRSPSTAQGFAPTGQDLPKEAQPATRTWVTPVGVAAGVWILGVCAFVIARIRAHLKFAARLKQPAAHDRAQPAALVAEVAAELGVLGIDIVLTDAIEAPALYGVFRPRLLLPCGLLEKLRRPELRLVVLHELCHHRRRDLLSQALIHAAQIVHWFNPLVWVAGRVARNDCELACDEDVMRSLGSMGGQAYGATLLKIISLSRKPSLAPLGVGIVESKRQIKRRIEMIVAHRPASFARSLVGCALLVLVAGCGATRESKVQPPAPTVAIAADVEPAGWWKNGSETNAYVVGIDPQQAHLGQPSAFVKSIVPSVAGFGGMMQMCKAEKFVGQRLRLVGWIKTENAKDGGAHLWFRVDGKEKDSMLQFDNMDGRQVKGTADWQQYSVVLDVPADSAALAYGFFISGTGEAWVSGVRIEQVGLDVPSTNTVGKKSRELPETPVNLEFAK